jgi:hypothetical protein
MNYVAHSLLLRCAVAGIIEPLERRMLLSLAPAGVEFRANGFTTSVQLEAAVASDADGDFVVVWSGAGSGDSFSGIFAQRYNSAGVAQGGEFRVNTPTAPTQLRPAVAMDADGDFVIVWESNYQEGGNNPGVYAQRFNAAGAPQGGEFHVNTFTTGQQGRPSVAMDASGNFVITWQSQQETGPTFGIYAQRYDAAGQPQGAEFHVNTFTTSVQRDPGIAMDADGDFVIAWHSRDQNGSGYGVYAQRFNSAGTAQGGEFQVDPSFPVVLNLSPVSVAMDASGDFVVTFTTYDDSRGVHGQRFNAAGVAQGGPFHVNTFTTGFQFEYSVAMDADGDFLVTWTSDAQDGSGNGVYAQAFNAAGVPQGIEFRVNTFTTGSQRNPTVTMNADGDAVIAWQGNGTGDSYGVYAQRYTESNADTAAPMLAGAFVAGNRLVPYSSHPGPLKQILVTFSENMTDAGGTTGANSVTNPANWLITDDGVSVTPTITYGFNPATNRFEALVTLAQAVEGNILLKARDNIRDIVGNRLDGNLDGTAGGSLLLPFSVGIAPVGGEFRVNTFTTGSQRVPSVGMNADGDFLIAWSSTNQDGSDEGVYRQYYSADGVPQGGEARANATTAGSQFLPAAAMLPRGTVSLATGIFWSGNGPGDSNGVFGQGLILPEFRLNTFTTDLQRAPAVAMDADGDFVVAWTSYGQDGSYSGVYAQRFNAAGTAQGAEFRVNSFTTDFQSFPAVAMDASGDFVVAWASYLQDGGGLGVYAQRFNAAGLPQGGEFRVNTTTSADESIPSVGMDGDGDFVIAWQSTRRFVGTSYGIFAQRYNAAGVPQGGEFKVNTNVSEPFSPAVAMDADGDFVVAWSDGEYQNVLAYDVYARRYTAGGVAIAQEFLVNTQTANFQGTPAVAMDAAGDFVVVWSSSGQDGSGFGVYAQRYGTRDTPTVGLLSDTPDPVTGGNSITLSASGVSSADGEVTSVSFYRESNGEPGLQVGLEGDTFVGTDTTPSGGFWSASASTAGLAPGTYTYYAQATDDAGLTGAPVSTTNTVSGGAAPSVTASQFLFETAPQRLRFTFDQNVSTSLSASDVTGIGTPNVDYTLSYDTNTNIATITFANILANGKYTATIVASGVTNPGGTPMAANHVFNFKFLRGDADNDGDVDVNDLGILASNWQQSPRTFAQGDFDYSSTVDVNDLGILASNWQQVLPASAATLNPVSVRSASKRVSVIRSLELLEPSNDDILLSRAGAGR